MDRTHSFCQLNIVNPVIFSPLVALEPAKHHCAELWHKNCRYVYPIGECCNLIPGSLVRLIMIYRYTHSKMVEINSHSLFSRWFSESGKLVGRLFASITELVEDDATFVVVLIGPLRRHILPSFIT